MMVIADHVSSMLEDKSISHLISWTANAESFVMQPSHEFSKVLAYVLGFFFFFFFLR